MISVKNFSGFVGIDADGSWVCTGHNKHKTERHPDPVSGQCLVSSLIFLMDSSFFLSLLSL